MRCDGPAGAAGQALAAAILLLAAAAGRCRRPTSTTPVPWLYCSYNKTAKKIVGKGGQRWYKNIGLGFRTPKEAIEGEHGCSDSDDGGAAGGSGNRRMCCIVGSLNVQIHLSMEGGAGSREVQHAAAAASGGRLGLSLLQE